MKVECTLVQQDWDGIIPALLAKKYDAIVASMSITEERKQKVDFTNKYYQTPARFVAKKGAECRDHQGRAGRQEGRRAARHHPRQLPHRQFRRCRSRSSATPRQDEANLDLVAGRVDLLLADSVTLSDGLLKTDKGKDFEFVGPAYSDREWFGLGAGIAIRKSDTDLRDKLNAGDRRDPGQRHLGQDRGQVLRLRRLRQLSRRAAGAAAGRGAATSMTGER